jgi:ketosteroid isomerase-like protein
VSEQNIELVRALQPAGGVDLVELTHAQQVGPAPADAAALFAQDFQCSFIAGEKSGFTSLSYSGVEGFIEGWREWLSPWESYRIEAEQFIDAGEQVVVLARVHARTRRDHVEMEHAPAAVWTLADGRVARIEFYLERSQALADAGLQGR